MLELFFFCTAHVAYSSHRWWPFLVALDSFRQDLFNSTSGVIIRVSVWLRVFLFFFFYFFSLSLLSVLNAMFIKFAIWKSGHDICDSQIIYVTYDFLNCIIFLNIFLFCVILLLFLLYFSPKTLYVRGSIPCHTILVHFCAYIYIWDSELGYGISRAEF
jgi:hypothetical protein